MPTNIEAKPQIKGAILGHQHKPRILDMSNCSAILCISIGNPNQTGEFLKDTIRLLKELHQLDKLTLCEASALKVFSIAFTILLNDSSNERDQKYKEALLKRWEKANPISIWQEIQAAREKFVNVKDNKAISDLLNEVEQSGDYVLGLVIRAQQTYDKWLGENKFLHDSYKQKNNIEILNWLSQILDKIAQKAVSQFIELYSANNENNLSVEFKRVVNSSITSILARKSIKKIDPASLIGKLSALYVIEESALLKVWAETEKQPKYNYHMYVNTLNDAMFYILRKYVWLKANDEEELITTNFKNLEFRLIESKVPEHELYKEFWGMENVTKEQVVAKKQVVNNFIDRSPITIYDQVLMRIKFSLDIFFKAIEGHYIPGFVVKLIEYTDANFEELEKVLNTLFPPCNMDKKLEDYENHILDCLSLKVRSISELDGDKSFNIVSKITLFGNKYVEKIESIKKDNGEQFLQASNLELQSKKTSMRSYSCTLM